MGAPQLIGQLFQPVSRPGNQNHILFTRRKLTCKDSSQPLGSAGDESISWIIHFRAAGVSLSTSGSRFVIAGARLASSWSSTGQPARTNPLGPSPTLLRYLRTTKRYIQGSRKSLGDIRFDVWPY